MCTAFSTWQRIKNKMRDPAIVVGELQRAKQHLEFCVELHREQAKVGRYFLYERPAYASSWQTQIIEYIMRVDGVDKATYDQCHYGCADSEGNPVKKPTSFMTNAPDLAKELGDRCNGRGGICSRPEKDTHTQTRQRTAGMAAI